MSCTYRLLRAAAVLVAVLHGTAGCSEECGGCRRFDLVRVCIASGECTLDGEAVSCSSAASDDCPLLDLPPGHTLGFDLTVRNSANDLRISIPVPAVGREHKATDLRDAALLIGGLERNCERSRLEIECANLPQEELPVEFRLEDDGSFSTTVYIHLQDSECIRTTELCAM